MCRTQSCRGTWLTILGDLKKTFLGGVRSAVEKEIEWIDERVAGGDRMREEWERRCEPEEPAEAAEPGS